LESVNRTSLFTMRLFIAYRAATAGQVEAGREVGNAGFAGKIRI
jgi:hypothetical protein